MSHRTLLSAASLFSMLSLGTAAHAQFADMRQSPTLYLQAGAAEKGTQTITVGSTVPMDWKSYWWGHAVTTHWDMSLSVWNSDLSATSQGHRNIAVIGLKPNLRFHSKSSSPWFVEAGLGGYVSNHLYESRDKRFSTAFNFGTHIGVGYFTGPRRQDEWTLRFEHLSNASIKKPNPGINLVQLRYARHF